jgi:hypothetical protein
MRVTYYDDFSRSYRLRPPFAAALWIAAASAVCTWVAMVW